MQPASPFFSAEGGSDPYPNYQRLRPMSPLPMSRSDANGAERTTWAFLKHDHVYDALRDHETFSSAAAMGGSGAGNGNAGGFSMVLINDDPPRHTRFRKLVNKAFTPRRIAELEPFIESVANELLDEMGSGEHEVVGAYTIPLPVIMIATLLGIPREERVTFKRWTDALLNFGAGGGEGRMAEIMQMVAYFGKMAAARRSEPASDLITALVQAEVDGEALQEWEILGFCVLLLVAGNETTTNLMGNMLNGLAQRPELWTQLREDRSLVPIVVEETLRWEGPVQMLFRTATKDVQVGNATIKAGDNALVSFGAANRDPDVFPNPDEFRLDRDLHNHVAFGMGIHYCLGSPLARAEAKVTLNTWLDRFERIEPGSEPGKRLGGMPIIYGFRELPLTLRA